MFFVDRLSTLLVEYALQHLPYVPKTVVTPVGIEAHGKQLDAMVMKLPYLALQLTKFCSIRVVCVSNGRTSQRSGECSDFILSLHFSGGTLERGFRRVIRDVPMGSLLIQSEAVTGEPMCLQVMLPNYVRYRHTAVDTWVFILDAQVSSMSVEVCS